MRVVALEEHFTMPSLTSRIDPAARAKRGFGTRSVHSGPADTPQRLIELSQKRLESMDAAGITVQVLSLGGPGADLVEGQAGADLAREINDALAQSVESNPRRLAGFAHLPMLMPDAAARELERAVGILGFHGALINGTTSDLFLDDPKFDSILSVAESLDVPIYIHPSPAPEAVRNVYYSNLPGSAGHVLETFGWGWHSETAIHVLRLVLAGTLDRHRKLKLIIGHMGEGLPVMLARCDKVSEAHTQYLERSISQAIVDQVWITTSGVFTQPPFLAALLTFGIDRILFSVDYPFSTNEQGRAFIDALSLSPADQEKLCHANADQLLWLS
jgi:predicted TIM-barrel fold metal-dependent hydrolase